MLRTLLDRDIQRYLMVNTFGRIDGYERAERHYNISRTIAKFLLLRNHDIERESIQIHDYLTTLTAFMDEMIDFPIDRPIYGDEYDIYIDRFFEWIVSRLNEIYNLISIEQ